MATQHVNEKLAGRKRSDVGAEINNDEIRKRGRPRLDPQVESAAERRRTQIRVAQRAYRQRKESTIDELRKQVQDLQSTIETMNQNFQQLSEMCFAEDASPDLIAGLRSIANQCSKLTGSVNTINTRGPSSPSSSSGDFGYKDFAATSGVGPTEANTRIKLSQAGSIQHDASHAHFTHSGLQPLPRATPRDGLFPERQPEADCYFDVGENAMMKPSIPKTMPVPVTYGYQEKTFARRLHRESCEFAYRTACNPSMLPQGYNGVFRLTLRASGGIERIKKNLENTLKKSVSEPLSNWGATFVFVGGAGTHYPRPTEEGGWMHRTQGPWAETNVGPHKLFGSGLEEAMTTEMLLRGTEGIEGEWFDAYDVEGYLAEKGIHLDAMCSYAEIELPKPKNSSTAGSSPSSSSSSSSASSVIPTANYGGPSAYYSVQHATLDQNMAYNHLGNHPLIGVPFVPFAPTAAVACAPPTTPSYFANSPDSGYAGSFAGQHYMANVPFPHQTQAPMRTKATVDVAEFIKIMSMSGTCLMRAPGYRRNTVDEALRRAVIRSY